MSVLPDANSASVRIRPLFTVGVMDISQLKQAKSADIDPGFIACTTDDVLASKPDLYDVLVLMPKSESQRAPTKAFPRIVLSSLDLTKALPRLGIRATQRDSHRFSHLLRGLQRIDSNAAAVGTELSSVLSDTSVYLVSKEVIEPSSWSRLAYTSYVWWASAGDRRMGFTDNEEDEIEWDHAMLQSEDEERQAREVAVVAYFHRMTTVIFDTIASAISRVDGDDQTEEQHHDDDNNDDEPNESTVAERSRDESQALLNDAGEPAEVEINHDDMVEMGLDSWSASDKKFVEELVELWWQRKAILRPISIECCGLQII